MRFGSRRQLAQSALAFARLSSEEKAAVRALAADDGVRVIDYVLERHDGILYADNGYSLVYDVTNARNTGADSIDEARRQRAASVLAAP